MQISGGVENMRDQVSIHNTYDAFRFGYAAVHPQIRHSVVQN